MSFSSWQDNQNTIERLKQMIRKGRIFHGCLFEGENSRVQRLADDFVKAALCERQDGDACGVCVSCRKFDAGNSEDVMFIGSEGTVKDKETEMLISAAMKKSYTGRPMFLVIRNAGRMTLRAQNRLLKTLEEPPSGVRILLLTENARLLTETIRSRCITFRLETAGTEQTCLQLYDGEADFSREDRKRALSLAENIIYGRPFYTMRSDIDYFSSSREKAGGFAETAELFYRDIFVSAYDSRGQLIINKDENTIIEKCARVFAPEQMTEAASAAESAQRDLSAGVGPGHALKYMIFDIQGKMKKI